ncbi:MAG: motif domain protein [Rhizobium sp.]|nr:motif domain protein [Rhizobium sp.]
MGRALPERVGAVTLKIDGPSNRKSRTPPVAVRRFLRAEVGFGCPICGSPHLAYHHFDPPWSLEKHHNPEGMIALCARHHDAADAGAFANEQLIELKTRKSLQVGSKFDWRRNHTVFVCGGSYAYNCESMLRMSGIDIIYFQKDDDGYDTLSLNIYDVCMNLIFSMHRNDCWQGTT